MDLITTSELQELFPALTTPWDGLVARAVNSKVARVAPCVFSDEGLAAEAEVIVFRAVERFTDTREFVASETNGPFSVTYVTGGRGVLDADDEAALAALCARPSRNVGPVGSFPEQSLAGSHLFRRL